MWHQVCCDSHFYLSSVGNIYNCGVFSWHQKLSEYGSLEGMSLSISGAIYAIFIWVPIQASSSEFNGILFLFPNNSNTNTKDALYCKTVCTNTTDAFYKHFNKNMAVSSTVTKYY